MRACVPAYPSAPDSALIAFAYQQALPFRPDSLVPLKLGESVPTSIMFTPRGAHQFNARVLFFTRGGRLRTFELGGGTMHFEVPKCPFLNGRVAVQFKLTFPATTCPLEDASQSPDDVQVAELFPPGDTAKEKGVALRMVCAADPPRAKMALTDANDASNTGSELSPTADSDAQGVRVQLLREGREVQFGQSWQFDSPTGGTLLHEFTARYLHTSDALVPGIIKGQTVLTADYGKRCQLARCLGEAAYATSCMGARAAVLYRLHQGTMRARLMACAHGPRRETLARCWPFAAGVFHCAVAARKVEAGSMQRSPDFPLSILWRCSWTLFALAAASAAHAGCVRLNPGDQDLVISMTMPNLDLPNRRFALQAQGGVLDGFMCSAGQNAFLTDVTFTGLTYEREIAADDGRTYSVYSLGPRSPLIGFVHAVNPPAGSTTRPSQDAVIPGQRHRNPGPVSAISEPVSVSYGVMLFFRGGAMESIPMTSLGTATSWDENDPSQSIQHHLRIEVNVPTLTCTLADSSQSLDPVSADLLATPGSTAGEKAVAMAMTCPSANVGVEMVLTDANDAGNVGSLLTPAAASDAGGVQLEMLRAGNPVQFGQRWQHGWSSKGSQDVPFTARYRRTADALQPGTIIGEAVLTATYR
ncbi:fimbrial protein [Stenotrophomonas indicatrix]